MESGTYSPALKNLKYVGTFSTDLSSILYYLGPWGGGGVLPSKTIGDVPLDGVAFSQLD